MPLTPEQRLSVAVDEDATLVLAGAGSGKTSVITAKAAYLVKAEIRKPHELRLLAFAKDAATEMSERIEAGQAGSRAAPHNPETGKHRSTRKTPSIGR
ncbi:hypothetical protein A3747_12710 [Sulfitobacter sp. HI0076]|nr:hypothetical protein A3720_01435 [Sulfitobacter sp. HI0021]KZY01842.1 hypothetical protein A3722_07165 [Sulfitobacter sp. HI0027]KZZ03202.1 hypothetical protein A3747_12710 [Sulfitobacter sp. HI0076]